MRRYKGFALQVLIAVVLFATIASCATLTQNSYRALYTAGVTYDTTLSIAGDLYKQGKLTEAQKAEVIKYATPFYSAYHGAVDAFEVWETTRLSTDKDKMVVAMTEMMKKASSLKDYLNRLKISKFDAVLDKLNELSELVNQITK